MRAAHAILVLLPLVLVAACSDDSSCDGAACQVAKARLGGRPIRDTAEKTFVTADGASYTLLRFEYGSTPECDEVDETDCSYSTYCTFVVDGVDYPLSASFVADEDAVFDLADYCTDLGCNMPADELAIFDDDAFDEWLSGAEADDDVLASCF